MWGGWTWQPYRKSGGADAGLSPTGVRPRYPLDKPPKPLHIPQHDRPCPDPQFLHRGPYRPRQVDPCRPADPADRHRGRTGHEGAAARLDGYRARARHHHQGQHRADRLSRAGRQDLCAEPDRHAGPCRLRLRSQPVDARGRGLASGGRRIAGGRGADAGQRLSGDRRRSRDRAGPQQGRPARRRLRPRGRTDRGRDRHRCLGRAAHLGQDRRGHPRRARGHRHPPAGPQGRPRRAAEGHAGRQLVRPLSRRRRHGPRDRRRGPQGRPHPHDADRGQVPDRQAVGPQARDDRHPRAWAGRDRGADGLDQAGARHPRGRHDHA